MTETWVSSIKTQVRYDKPLIQPHSEDHNYVRDLGCTITSISW